ncbi:MAG: hypothetical protein JWL63_337 [Rhodocyclales bacterium]|nr:hypothetical protein [Rhodocyclales bacterium]
MIDNAAIFFGCAAMIFVALRLVRVSVAARNAAKAGKGQDHA